MLIFNIYNYFLIIELDFEINKDSMNIQKSTKKPLIPNKGAF